MLGALDTKHRLSGRVPHPEPTAHAAPLAGTLDFVPTLLLQESPPELIS